MTDKERFEEWLAVHYPGLYVGEIGTEIFLAALAIGRKERTVEIANLMRYRVSYVASDEVKLAYTECFEEGEKS